MNVTELTTELASGLASEPVGEQQDPHCLATEALAQLLVASPWRRLAVVGDSIAAGVGDPVDGYRDVSWADRLAEVLGGPGGSVDHLNLGVPHLRATEIRVGQLDRALAFEPDVAVVSAGPNDMLRRSFDADHVARELDHLLGALSASGCLVVTFGLLDLSRTGLVPDEMRADLRDRLLLLNATTRTATERHDGVHVDFFDHPALDDGLFSADLIHPNRRGHACIATSVVVALAERLTERRATDPRPTDRRPTDRRGARGR